MENELENIKNKQNNKVFIDSLNNENNLLKNNISELK